MSLFRRMLVVPVLVLAALGGVLASSTAAQAVPPDPPCEWDAGERGSDSGCDGLSPISGPHLSYCGVPTLVDTRTFGPPGNTIARINLYYARGPRTGSHPNGGCRTVSAAIHVEDQGASCYVKLERTSDLAAYRVGGTLHATEFTPTLYDADVTSYAWGHCTFNGGTYTAQTIYW